MTRSGLLVAVVDDDASVRKAVARLLRASGFEVDVFASGGDFLETVNGAPDCLLLDMHMPQINGLDVQAALRARGKQVPIIFITAYDDSVLRERALEQGAAAYLRKPLAEQKLLDAIAAAVGHRKGN